MRVLTAAALALICGCTQPPAPAPPPRIATNVLIITIDTRRADRVGVYGATNVTTPNLDRLAREGAWAPQSDAPVPLTRPSHVSLFTGRYPSEHGIRDNLSAPLNADVPLLAGIFQQPGFATAAFIGSTVLDRQSGLARGFDVYSDRFDNGVDQRTGDVVTADAIGWIRSPPKPKFFAWIHLYDPHAPYTPPEPYASRYAGRGKMPDAEHAFGEAVKREPTNGLYHYNHGLALQQLGRRDEATTEFQQAQSLGYRAP